MEFGLASFGDINLDPETGQLMTPGKRLQHLVEEIELADQVGLDVYGVGEHHRPDYAVSAPEIVLANAAARTSNIHLSSAVTVLSSADPVRTWQNFATIDQLSNGRAEIWAGRGSFIESFPLFGQNLDDYDQLFSEHLDLLLTIRDNEIVTWKGELRAPIDGRGVYPRSFQEQLPIWLAVGGTPSSAKRAGKLGLPMVLAIIGGAWPRFAPFAQLFRDAAQAAGHDRATTPLAINSIGFIAEDSQKAFEQFYPGHLETMNRIGRERGWGAPMQRADIEQQASLPGALYVGSPQQIVEKILAAREVFEHERFVLQFNAQGIPHREILRSIELFGTEVVPVVKRELAKQKSESTPEPIAL